MNIDFIKPLLESGLINEDIGQQINEAWEAKLVEAKEQVRAELRLTHTRRDVDNHALFLTLNHICEDFGQLPVVRPDFEARVDGSREPQHVVLGSGQPCAVLAQLQIVEQLHLILDGHRWQCAFERLQLTLGDGRQFGQVHLVSA